MWNSCLRQASQSRIVGIVMYQRQHLIVIQCLPAHEIINHNTNMECLNNATKGKVKQHQTKNEEDEN